MTRKATATTRKKKWFCLLFSFFFPLKKRLVFLVKCTRALAPLIAHLRPLRDGRRARGSAPVASINRRRTKWSGSDEQTSHRHRRRRRRLDVESFAADDVDLHLHHLPPCSGFPKAPGPRPRLRLPGSRRGLCDLSLAFEIAEGRREEGRLGGRGGVGGALPSGPEAPRAVFFFFFFFLFSVLTLCRASVGRRRPVDAGIDEVAFVRAHGAGKGGPSDR